MKENGYCTLYDKRFNKFTAYCDFTSEPGYAWTLVASFERDIVRGEATQVNGLPYSTYDRVYNSICLFLLALNSNLIPRPTQQLKK